MSSHIRNNAHQAASGHDVGIYLNTVRRTFVDPEYLKPVTRVLRNDPGSNLLILHIVLIQIIKLPQTLQFKLFRLQAAVLLHQRVDAFLQSLLFRHGAAQRAVVADSVVK